MQTQHTKGVTEQNEADITVQTQHTKEVTEQNEADRTVQIQHTKGVTGLNRTRPIELCRLNKVSY